MSQWKDVTRAELDAYVKAYPRKLVLDIARMCEPHMANYNDFALGNWPESMVARYSLGDPEGSQAYWGPEKGWQVMKPVPEAK